jgi:hypothetical protein
LRKLSLLFIACFLPAASFSQRPYLLTDSSTADVKNYAILPDRGYGIERIVADSTLLFVVNDSLKPQKHASCWIRIIINNPFPYQEKYNIWLFPYMNNTRSIIVIQTRTLGKGKGRG